MATINHVACSWSMINLQTNLSGESEQTPILVDATAISWSSERRVDNVYGLGGQPRGRGFGNVTYNASITIPYATQDYLRQKSEDGTLMGLGEFNLVVSWINDLAENLNMETVTLAGCFFAQSGMSASQDDTSIQQEFDLHPYRIYTPSVQENGGSWSHELYGNTR